ncbi:MAG: hypothetical protein JW910_04555 [Anaerolineae bacterium]|nr:hypothetical protein [Anaerolineae bacterium]
MAARRALLLILLGVSLMAAVMLVLPSAQAQDDNGIFTIQETTFESHFPHGMTFIVRATSSVGEITRATLFYTLRTGMQERFNATFDTETATWVAAPYTPDGGLGPWVDFEYTWLLRDAAGNSFETEAQYAVYADHQRFWHHEESDALSLYWYGELPDLGEQATEAMATMRPFFEQGWGRLLSYKPLVIVYPAGGLWDEYVQMGDIGAGFADWDRGYTIITMYDHRTPAYHASLRDLCGGYYTGTVANNAWEWHVQSTLSNIIHEIVHMYQRDFHTRGPAWWIEGQAQYFPVLALGWSPWNADSRLHSYALQGYSLATLQGEVGGRTSTAPDGCAGLDYALGDSFLRWLLTTYDGLDTHRAIIENMPGNGLHTAIEIATGVPFIELENQWRAMLGLEPVSVIATVTPFILPTAPMPTFPTTQPATGSS